MNPSGRSIAVLCLFLSWITPLVGVTLCCRWDSPEPLETPMAAVDQSTCEHEAPASTTRDGSHSESNQNHACCQNACARVFSAFRRHESPIFAPVNLIFPASAFPSVQSAIFRNQMTDSDQSPNVIRPPASVPLALYVLNVSYRI